MKHFLKLIAEAMLSSLPDAPLTPEQGRELIEKYEPIVRERLNFFKDGQLIDCGPDNRFLRGRFIIQQDNYMLLCMFESGEQYQISLRRKNLDGSISNLLETDPMPSAGEAIELALKHCPWFLQDISRDR